MQINHKAISTAAEFIANADAIIIAAGAGMGVDSGLPDLIYSGNGANKKNWATRFLPAMWMANSNAPALRAIQSTNATVRYITCNVWIAAAMPYGQQVILRRRLMSCIANSSMSRRAAHFAGVMRVRIF